RDRHALRRRAGAGIGLRRRAAEQRRLARRGSGRNGPRLPPGGGGRPARPPGRAHPAPGPCRADQPAARPGGLVSILPDRILLVLEPVQALPVRVRPLVEAGAGWFWLRAKTLPPPAVEALLERL